MWGVQRQKLECELQALDEKESVSNLTPVDRLMREGYKVDLE
jgi:hypothetical protein